MSYVVIFVVVASRLFVAYSIAYINSVVVIELIVQSKLWIEEIEIIMN